MELWYNMKNGQPSTFVYAQGGRFNYIYGGDINNDGSPTNDLNLCQQLHAQLQTMVLTHLHFNAQRAAYDNFISQDSYLSGRRAIC
jgi:hypothetical protein